jgi:hypothetical protein
MPNVIIQIKAEKIARKRTIPAITHTTVAIIKKTELAKANPDNAKAAPIKYRISPTRSNNPPVIQKSPASSK